ncbi:hypothetical protein [Nocardia shimofusensis]|uniref:hypothetical protein n=1 Tax=Nocardia shimofusensis TaxID=228596 RepID=UPI00082A518A|nr:hypothetical protein [Nocardia shimofusensis]
MSLFRRNCQNLWFGLFQATSVSVVAVGSGEDAGVSSRGRSMVAELSDVMRARGYAPTSPLVVDISDDAVWFASEVGEGVGFTRSVIRIDIGWLPDGSAIVNGEVALMSDEVAEVLRAVPQTAELRGAGADYKFHRIVDGQPFIDFPDAEARDRAPRVTRAEDVAIAADWLMRKTAGPAVDWLADRDSITKLVEVARTPLSGGVSVRVDPMRFRAIVVLCILNGSFKEAAALMAEHLRRDYSQVSMESRERAAAFDVYLHQSFPAYAAHERIH